MHNARVPESDLGSTRRGLPSQRESRGSREGRLAGAGRRTRSGCVVRRAAARALRPAEADPAPHAHSVLSRRKRGDGTRRALDAEELKPGKSGFATIQLRSADGG